VSTPKKEDGNRLGVRMLEFVTSIQALNTPKEVLDSLDKVSSAGLGINVLVAALLPIRRGDWSGFERGKTVFLH